jgi:hypothetical protein
MMRHLGRRFIVNIDDLRVYDGRLTEQYVRRTPAPAGVARAFSQAGLCGRDGMGWGEWVG